MEKRRGIRSLIPTGTLPEQAEETIQEIPVEKLSSNPFQPRKEVREQELADLVASVREHGILQPLVVRRRGETLELIAGERRLEAARRAGLTRVPVIVREATDREMLELALVENLQREDISAVDAAEAYARLTAEFGLTQEQVADRVGKSRSAVANAIRLLSLPPNVLQSIRRGEMEAAHGRLLLTITDRALLLRVWRRVVRRRLSTRQTEQVIERLAARGVSRGTKLGEPNKPARGANYLDARHLDPNLRDLLERVQQRLSAKVRLRVTGATSGVLEISYADSQDLDRLFWEIMEGGAGTEVLHR